jgi:hypothetical protein
MSLVLPQLSPAGLRSLLYLLQKNQYVLMRKQGEATQLCLSQIGKAMIEAEIPALTELKPGTTSWSLLTFLTAPESDRNFRYLRLLLLQHRWLAITRGVFIYPGQPTESVLRTIQRLYPSSVAIMQVDKWLWGDYRLVIGQQDSYNQANDVYSGISKELAGLISNHLAEKEFDDQTKLAITSIFDRLYHALCHDFTLGESLESQIVPGRELLRQLQLLG